MSASMLEEVREVARRWPTALAFVAGDEAIDYGALVRRIDEAAAGLQAGVHVVRGGAIEAVIAAFAVRAAGGVPLVVGPQDGVDATFEGGLGAAWLRTTSGTSGAPRVLTVDEAQALATARVHVELTGLGPGVGCVVTVPPWTSYGWNLSLIHI